LQIRRRTGIQRNPFARGIFSAGVTMTLLSLLVACTPSTVPGSPMSLPDRDFDELPPPPASAGADVVINEFQADNKSTWQDSETLELPDWVELYNAGSSPAALADLTLVDSSGSTWRGPDDAFLAPGETLFLEANGGNDDFELPFQLSSVGGETLALLYQGQRADIVPVGELGRDLSLARFPDGGTWQATARPTPGYTNGSSPPDSLDPSDLLFQPYVMHQIDVRVPRSQYDAIDDRIQVPCEFTIDGIYYPKVGINSTGEASYDTMNGKPRFVFNLDAYDSANRFRGVDNIELHNGRVVDETRGRDWVGYRLFGQMGSPSSRVGFAHVTINDDNYGLYVMVEDPDGSFVAANFPASADTGMIFEGEPSDFGNGNPESFDYEVGPLPPPAGGVASIVAVDDIVAGASSDKNLASLWRYMDEDETLGYIAEEAMANSSDGYRAPHNWRFYVDGVDNMIHMVPSGIEISWQQAPELWGGGGNLIGFCMDNPGCKRDYAQRVLDLAALMDDDGTADRFMDVENWLLPWIDADPRKFATLATTKTVIQSTYDNLKDGPSDARHDVFAVFPDLKP
jgi:hypothetical protein